MGQLLLLPLQENFYAYVQIREENPALKFYVAAQMKLIIGAMHTARKEVESNNTAVNDSDTGDKRKRQWQ